MENYPCLNRAEKFALLEALKCHADEGWHLAGHYAEDRADRLDVRGVALLAIRLCGDLGLPHDQRAWIDRDLAAGA